MNQISILKANGHIKGVHVRDLAEAIGIPESRLKVGIKYQSLQKDQLFMIHGFLNTEKSEKKITLPRVSLYARKDFSLDFMSSKIFF